MTRDQLIKMLDAIIVFGNKVGSPDYFEELHERLGFPFSGEPISAYLAREIIIEAFDEGLL